MSVPILSHRDWFPFAIAREGIDFAPVTGPIAGYPAAVPITKLVEWWWKVQSWTCGIAMNLTPITLVQNNSPPEVVDFNYQAVNYSGTQTFNAAIQTNVATGHPGTPAVIPARRVIPSTSLFGGNDNLTEASINVGTPGYGFTEFQLAMFVASIGLLTSYGPIILRQDGLYYPAVQIVQFNYPTQADVSGGTSPNFFHDLYQYCTMTLGVVPSGPQYISCPSTIDGVTFPAWMEYELSDPDTGSPVYPGGSGSFTLTRTDW